MLKVDCEQIAYRDSKIVIEHAHFVVQPGSTLGLMGPSGSGKSTLLRVIARLEPEIEGQVEIEGSEAVAMLFQDYDCYPWMSVWQNLLFASRLGCHGTESLETLLGQFGLSESKNAWPWQLSGGMRKRLGLLRAVISESDVILLDEPFASLDFNTKVQVSDVLLRTIKSKKKQVVLVSHGRRNHAA